MTRPRRIARVHQPDGRVETIPCDAARVEGDYLVLSRLDVDSRTATTVACFAPGAWTSYHLQPTVTREDVEHGNATINDWRKQHGLPPYQADDLPLDGDAEAERRPRLGDVLHIHQAGCYGCLAGRVTYTFLDCANGLRPGVVLHCDNGLTYQSTEHDETRTVDSSWHWPCDGDTATPEPDAPAPDSSGAAQIVVRIEGLIDGRRLYEDVQRQALRNARLTF